MSIESLRKKIDAVDDNILRLLNSRAEFAIEIGKLKKRTNTPIYNPTREKEVIERLLSLNEGPFDAQSIKALFERIIDETRTIEHKLTKNDSKHTDPGS